MLSNHQLRALVKALFLTHIREDPNKMIPDLKRNFSDWTEEERVAVAKLYNEAKLYHDQETKVTISPAIQAAWPS